MRVRHQPADRRIKISLDRVRLDIAPGENAREQFRRAAALDDGERAPRSSSRSRQARPVAERTTPRKGRAGGSTVKTFRSMDRVG
jgi:hypothetical protein